MEQTMQNEVQRATTVLINFRAQPEDAAALKDAAARKRTNVSSLVRGALLQVGLLENHQGEEVKHVL